MKYLLLVLLFTTSAVASSIPQETITQSEDDAQKLGLTSYSTSGSSITIGRTVSNDLGIRDAMLRFQTVPLSQGQEIDSAFISVVSSGNATGVTVIVQIACEDTADATTFVDYTDYAARAWTTAVVAWSPGAWTSGTTYKTPDIKTCIQEVLDRGDWVSGNDLSIRIINNGSSTSAYRSFYAYDNSSNLPLLDIYYTAAASGPPDVLHTSTGTGIIHGPSGNSNRHGI